MAYPREGGLDPSRMPRHIAIIMDGNGRWARQRGLPRIAGHRAGVESLKEVVKACLDLNIPILTVYAFSTENWKRPREEVEALMELLVHSIRNELEDLKKNGVKIRVSGRWQGLPLRVREEMERACRETVSNQRLILNVALNYGGRAELVDACRALAGKVKEGFLDPKDIGESLLEEHLYTYPLPDPDLLIRPSGEKRISNFLLWQLAYTELWFTEVYWPDFRREHLLQALEDYQKRERRFGGIASERG
ncbi:MAG TPA: isoprenyl transferase [Moorella mulderi]|nr:isoprenyl transferase [Moorella mulderi]